MEEARAKYMVQAETDATRFAQETEAFSKTNSVVMDDGLIGLDSPKPFWTVQIHFGPIEGHGISIMQLRYY